MDNYLGEVTVDKVYNSYFESDDRLLITKPTRPANKISRLHSHKPRKTPRHSLETLQNENVYLEFSNKLNK